MHLTDDDRHSITYDDLARVADCAICHEEARVWPYDNGRGDEIELCADCADLFGRINGDASMNHPNQPPSAPDAPFTIGQQVYLREGTNTGYGCEPVTVVGLEWRKGSYGNDHWRVQVALWSPRSGHDYHSSYLDADEFVATADEIEPQYRDAEADDATAN